MGRFKYPLDEVLSFSIEPRNRVQNMSEGEFEIVHKDGHRDASVALPGTEAKAKGERFGQATNRGKASMWCR